MLTNEDTWLLAYSIMPRLSRAVLLICFLLCIVLFLLHQITERYEPGTLRLAGGNESAGRVEVFLNDQWGTVCDDFWDLAAASVACRQMGFRGALEALPGAAFGEGSSVIHIDDIMCVGDETELISCEHKTIHNCNHAEDASAVCNTEGNSICFHGA